MIVQISSGQGPAECELAVSRLLSSLKEEFPDINVLGEHRSRFSGELTSVTFETEADLSDLEGSIQWITKSPYRPSHKRKNWFVDVSLIPEERAYASLQEKDVKLERFHCGGNGGQNVNKVETGVRLIHIPTGLTVTATSERSQHANRKTAMNRLRYLLKQEKLRAKSEHTNEKWREHYRIVRVNPTRVYKGEECKRVK